MKNTLKQAYINDMSTGDPDMVKNSVKLFIDSCIDNDGMVGYSYSDASLIKEIFRKALLEAYQQGHAKGTEDGASER